MWLDCVAKYNRAMNEPVAGRAVPRRQTTSYANGLLLVAQRTVIDFYGQAASHKIGGRC